jgi:hypothetical protein
MDTLLSKLILSNSFFVRASVFLGLICYTAVGHILHDGGWDTGIGRSTSIKPNCRFLIDNPPAGKTGQKLDIK